jgi:hypothetical protein
MKCVVLLSTTGRAAIQACLIQNHLESLAINLEHELGCDLAEDAESKLIASDSGSTRHYSIAFAPYGRFYFTLRVDTSTTPWEASLEKCAFAGFSEL